MNTFRCRVPSFNLVVSTFLLSLACSTLTNAALIGSPSPPTISVTSSISTSGFQYAPKLKDFATEDPADTSFELKTPSVSDEVLGGTTDITVQEFEFDPDPFVLNNILVTNNSGVTQGYSVSVSLPTVFGAPNFISGSLAASVIDGGADGATLSTVGLGIPIYQAQIDFATVASLLLDPYSLAASPPLPGAVVASFGPLVNLLPVTSNIRILLNFNLTAGDTASILSRFDVVAIPEPATLFIAVCGGMGMIVMARRQVAGRA